MHIILQQKGNTPLTEFINKRIEARKEAKMSGSKKSFRNSTGKRIQVVSRRGGRNDSRSSPMASGGGGPGEASAKGDLQAKLGAG